MTIKGRLARSVPFVSRSITFLPFRIASSVALPIVCLAKQHCFLTGVCWPLPGNGRTKQDRARRRWPERPRREVKSHPRFHALCRVRSIVRIFPIPF